MSIQQGLISPPLSGRTYKPDQPRIKHIHTAVKAADVFGGAPSSSSAVHHSESGFEHRHHTIRSPVKKQYDHLSHADRAVRPLTPPMSKDVRHDDQSCQPQDPNGHYRLSSEADHLDARPCSFSTSQVDIEAAPVQVPTSQPSVALASASNNGLLQAARVGNRFDTLNQAIGFESDDEHNPFLDRRRTAAPSSSSSTTTEVSKATASTHTQSQPHAHHSHPYYDDFDSDQDAEGSVHEDDIRDDATPRASSSNPTTPPARIRPITYRPARPFSTRVRVDNQPVTSIMPIRDTPKNPFLAGGPADNGFHGPNGHLAYRRAKHIPGKERGKIAYVFRGQRVIYADPEYAPDDDDDSDEERARTNQFNPHHNPNRPPRLQPKLLFPPTASASSLAACQNSTKSARMGSAMQYSAAHSAGRRSNASSAYLPRAELAEDAFGGSTSSSSYEEESYAPRTGGGLFAAQIAAKHKQEMVAPKVTASYSSRTHYNEKEEHYPLEQHHVEEVSTARHHHTDHRGHREAIAPSSSARLQSVTHHIQSNRDARQAGFEGRQAARDALLARLDQTNWSDDEEEEDDRHNDAGGGHDHSFSSRRHARCGSEGTVEEQEYLVESHILPRSQSQHKRLSEELHPGHADEVDVSGRPMKRSRASFAY